MLPARGVRTVKQSTPPRVSPMWDYFVKLKDEPGTVLCKICSKKLKARSTTSSLHKHLARKHPDLYKEATGVTIDFEKGKEIRMPVTLAPEELDMRSGFKRKSVVWYYFTEVLSGKVECNLCGTVYKHFDSGTSVYFKHLKSKHPSLYVEAMAKKGIKVQIEPHPVANEQAARSAPLSPLCETINKDSCNPDPLPPRDDAVVESEKLSPPSDVVKKKSSPVVSSRKKSSPVVSSRKKASSDKAKEKVNKHLLKLISINLLPPSIVEIKEFKDMLKALDGRYELPTKSAVIKTLLPDFAFEIKNKLKTDVDSASHFALTVETWKYRHSKSCMTVMAHFITDSWHTSSIVLETVNYPEQNTSESMIQEMRRITDEWGIGEKVVTLVSDPSEMLSTAAVTMGWEHLFCFGEKLNSVILTALESVPEVTKILKKVNEVAEYFDLNMKASEVLLSVQQQHNLPEKKLKTRLENKWMTLYGMMERMSEQFEAANTVLCYNAKDDMCLCDEEVELMRSVAKVLKLFVAVVTEFSSFEYPCMSRLIPLRNVLQEVVGNFVDESVEPSAQLTAFRDFLLQQMEAQFGNLERNSTLATCTLLDPRFKHHAFTDSSAVEDTQEQLIEEMTSVARSSSTSKEVSEEFAVTKEETGKESHDSLLSTIWNSFEKRVSNAGAKKSVLSEVENESRRYFKEALLSRNEDPLQWWKLNQVQFPHLQVLAKKYLCIPATSVCSSRLFSRKGVEVNTSRNKIKPTDLNTMVFLSSNIKLS